MLYLYGYVMLYDSYKNHSKYPFDNYRITILQCGGVDFYGIVYFIIELQACNYTNWQLQFFMYNRSKYYTIEK